VVKHQQQTPSPNGHGGPGRRAQVESISAMIERVAKEHRLRRAAAAEAAAPVAIEPPAVPQAAPVAPAAAVASAARPRASEPSDLQRVTCAKGHPFVMLAEHPRIDGIDACPHCMANTIQEYRKMFAAMVRPPRFE
jgi:hypothetical protein